MGLLQGGDVELTFDGSIFEFDGLISGVPDVFAYGTKPTAMLSLGELTTAPGSAALLRMAPTRALEFPAPLLAPVAS